MPEKNRFPAVMQPVVIDRAAFNQGENAQYEPHIGESEVMDSLVARGPHAVGVPFRKAKRAQSTTDDETWVDGEVSKTLNNFDLGDTRTTHAVVEPVVPPVISPTVTTCKGSRGGCSSEAIDEITAIHLAQQQHTMPGSVAPTDPKIVQASELRLRGQITEKDVCPTLTAGAKQGDTDPLAVHAISFQPGNLRRQAGADPSTDVFPTVTKDSGDQSPHVAIPPMAVRRLTPEECEKLQGFKPGWSRIPWKGKPEEECPDGPRYKACGNSMAVPVMRWIGERIAQADQTFFPR